MAAVELRNRPAGQSKTPACLRGCDPQDVRITLSAAYANYEQCMRQRIASKVSTIGQPISCGRGLVAHIRSATKEYLSSGCSGSSTMRLIRPRSRGLAGNLEEEWYVVSSRVSLNV